VHLADRPDDQLLLAHGWLRLSGLLRRLGHPGADRWAIRVDGVVCGAADFHQAPAADAVHAVLDRAARRREVRLREVLELRALARSMARFPPRHPALAAAAAVEAGHGGDLLRQWLKGEPQRGPVRLPRSRLPSPAAMRRRAVPHRFVVALSGVDGSGKSTTARRLAADLRAAGIPVAAVWTRPGMGLGPLVIMARLLKRLARNESAPALREMASGPDARPPSRRGAVGWVWTLAVTLAFLADVWHQHLRASGVVLYDRHLLDALATLEVLYRGTGLGLSCALVRRLLPRADVTLYLRVPAEVAWARKPDEAFQEYAVHAQVAVYEELVSRLPQIVVLDGQTAPATLSSQALEHLLVRA
jgi:thymidylate kinase